MRVIRIKPSSPILLDKHCWIFLSVQYVKKGGPFSVRPHIYAVKMTIRNTYMQTRKRLNEKYKHDFLLGNKTDQKRYFMAMVFNMQFQVVW